MSIIEQLNQNPIANHEAERIVIGTMAAQFEACVQYVIGLTARDFDLKEHQAIFKAMRELHNRKKAVDLVTLDDAFSQADKERLTECMIDASSAALIAPASLPSYVEILKRATARRDFVNLGKKLQEAGAAEDFDAAQLTERIRMYLKGMGQTDGEETHIRQPLINLLDRVTSPRANRRGIEMGIENLDEITDGFKPSRMYVIGARPKVGKTVFGINAALKCALDGKPVLYFNREMEKEDLLQRMAANVSGVSMGDMERGTLSEEQVSDLVDIIGAMDALPLHICNRAKSPAEIRSKVSEIHEKYGLGMVVVDYLQRIRADGKHRSKDEEIGEISFALKDIAMDYKVPVLLLSQLNRSATNVRPNMSMLRESGNIEQDADVIMMLQLEKRSRPDGPRKLYVTKNKEGELFQAILTFDGRYQRFAKGGLLDSVVAENKELKQKFKGPRPTPGPIPGQFEMLPTETDVPFKD